MRILLNSFVGRFSSEVDASCRKALMTFLTYKVQMYIRLYIYMATYLGQSE